MPMIHLEYEDQIAVLKLNRGITNAINLQLVTEFVETLRRVKCDADVRSLVVASANDKFFSIGFDIPQLFELTNTATPQATSLQTRRWSKPWLQPAASEGQQCMWAETLPVKHCTGSHRRWQRNSVVGDACVWTTARPARCLPWLVP